MKKEGSQVVTNCNALKLVAPDGKEYLTDVADAETLLRVVQSVPSPKAESLKLWLAKVGNERLKDVADPALSVDRAREYWLRQGRSDKWVQRRIMGQETRNKLTDYWKMRKYDLLMCEGGEIGRCAVWNEEVKNVYSLVSG